VKLAVLALLTLLPLAIDSCARPAYGETGNRLNYIVDVRDPADHNTPVSLELVVNQGPTQIAFVTKPGRRAGQDEGKRVTINAVFGGSGRSLNTEHPGSFLWRVTRTDNDIRINYTVDWIQPHAVPGRPDFEAYLGTWGGYIKEYFLLLRPVLRVDTVTVKFLLPDRWALITHRDFVNRTTYSFPGDRFQYFGTMWAALVAVGTPKVLTRFQAGGVHVEIFTYTDTLTTAAHTLADRFSRVLTYYDNVFGGSIFKRYVISACGTPGPRLTSPAFHPIIDAHGHLNGDMTAERLIELMDRAGVRRMVLMARYYGARAGGLGSDEQALDYARKYPCRFIPFVAGQRGFLVNRKRWLKPDWQAENLLQEAEAKLKSGGFYGLGELIMLHYAYTTRHGETGDVP